MRSCFQTIFPLFMNMFRVSKPICTSNVSSGEPVRVSDVRQSEFISINARSIVK